MNQHYTSLDLKKSRYEINKFRMNYYFVYPKYYISRNY